MRNDTLTIFILIFSNTAALTVSHQLSSVFSCGRILPVELSVPGKSNCWLHMHTHLELQASMPHWLYFINNNLLVTKYLFEILTTFIIGVGPTGLLIFSFSYFDIKYVYLYWNQLQSSLLEAPYNLVTSVSIICLDPLPSSQPAAFMDEIQTSFPE